MLEKKKCDGKMRRRGKVERKKWKKRKKSRTPISHLPLHDFQNMASRRENVLIYLLFSPSPAFLFLICSYSFPFSSSSPFSSVFSVKNIFIFFIYLCIANIFRQQWMVHFSRNDISYSSIYIFRPSPPFQMKRTDRR